VEFPALPAARLTPDRTSFVETARIRGYEAGPDRRATIQCIANLLQEVASNHAISVWGKTEEGFAASPVMVERNLIFVISRLHIKINKYPSWGETTRLETWFTLERRFIGRRAWSIQDASTSETLGEATSSWVVLNTKTRKMSRIPAEMVEQWWPYTLQDSCKYALSGVAELDKKIQDPETMAQVRSGVVHVAGQSFMDMNGHINNVAYLEWALDALPQEVFDNFDLKETEIDFKGECSVGDHVETVLYRADSQENGTSTAPVFVHVLRKASGDHKGQEIARLRTSWLKV